MRVRGNRPLLALGAAICFLLAAAIEGAVGFAGHVRGIGLAAIAFGIAGLLWLAAYFRQSKAA